MSKDDQTFLVLALIAAGLFFIKTRVTTELKQTCVFPDGTEILVPLGAECPFDEAHGGQSAIVGA